MTINASTGCGIAGITPGAGDPSISGGTAADVAGADAGPSAFSAALSSIAEPAEATEAQAQVILEELEDTALTDPEASPADAGAQMQAAAFMPVIAPAVMAQLRQGGLPVAEAASATAANTRLAQQPALDSRSLAADFLAQAAAAAAGDPVSPDVAGSAEILDTLATPGNEPANMAFAGKSPGPGFSPLTLVSQLGSAIAQATAPQPQLPLQHGVGTARWAEELGARLTMMASQGQLSGSLTLSPEHLGPLQVQIDINNDVAKVWFGSQHADTRAALHDALPRLREMFVASGLVLGDTGVSRDTPRQEAHTAELRRFASQQDEPVTGGSERRALRISHTGIIDTYA